MSAPWMKFYPSDWRADPKLRMCSIGARGLWIEMICVMHEAEPYGFLVSNGKALLPRQLAALAGISQGECMKYLLELASAGVYSVDENKLIYSRRMVRDKAKADRDRENGKGGGNPKLKVAVKEEVNPPDKAQKPEARSHSPEYSEAKASAAVAPSDPRSRLFDEGLSKIAAMTGKGPDSCRSFIGKCLKAASDDASVVIGLIDDAERNRVVDAPGWISARLKEPRSVAVQKITIDEAVAQFARVGIWSRHAPVSDVSQASAELLAQHGLGPDGRKLAASASKGAA
jgi:hypothetical protein